jgi:hypothetical protein
MTLRNSRDTIQSCCQPNRGAPTFQPRPLLCRRAQYCAGSRHKSPSHRGNCNPRSRIDCHFQATLLPIENAAVQFPLLPHTRTRPHLPGTLHPRCRTHRPRTSLCSSLGACHGRPGCSSTWTNRFATEECRSSDQACYCTIRSSRDLHLGRRRKHPLWCLQVTSIRSAHGDTAPGVMDLSSRRPVFPAGRMPSEDRKLLSDERVKQVVNRHCRRRGIVNDCCSIRIFTRSPSTTSASLAPTGSRAFAPCPDSRRTRSLTSCK